MKSSANKSFPTYYFSSWHQGQVKHYSSSKLHTRVGTLRPRHLSNHLKGHSHSPLPSFSSPLQGLSTWQRAHVKLTKTSEKGELADCPKVANMQPWASDAPPQIYV
eukprot:86055-Pelagomonas_calceolata.AAC.7